MFERFTDRARRVVVLAQEEARLLSHNYIGTEHILLGLVHEGEGVASAALERFDVGLDAVRQQVREIIGEGTQAASGHIPFTPRAKKVLELSLREALQLGHNYIGTEHILLGVLREGEGVAVQILVRLGADLNAVRHEAIRITRGEAGAVFTRTARARPLQDIPAGVESAMFSRFRARLRKVEARLGAVEQRTGTAPEETEADTEIARLRQERQSAADAQDYEKAAALRDTERELLAGQAARHEAWAAENPSLPELAETVRALGAEVQRLGELLLTLSESAAQAEDAGAAPAETSPAGDDEPGEDAAGAGAG